MIYSVKVEKRNWKSGDAQEVVQPVPLLVGSVGPAHRLGSRQHLISCVFHPAESGKASAQTMAVV